MKPVKNFRRVPNLDFETMMTDNIQRQQLPKDHVVKIGQVDRASTARECMDNFFGAIRLVESSPDRQDFDALTIGAVGLKADGRSSVFDLFYFKRTRRVFAVDVEDKTYVCEMSEGVCQG